MLYGAPDPTDARRRAARWAGVAALLAGGMVAAGAFGAHAVADQVTPARLDTFRTGALYGMVHALALFGVALALRGWPGAARPLGAAAWLFVAGVVLFSGSLFGLVLLDRPALGAVTPVGGVCFLAGWLCVAVGAFRAGRG